MKLLAAVGLLLVAAVFIFFLVLNRSVLPKRIEAELSGLEERYGVEFSFKKVRYRPLSNVRVSGVNFSASPASSFVPLPASGRIEELNIKTTLKSVLIGKPVIQALHLDGISVRISPKAEISRHVPAAEPVAPAV
mgnify:CR=1 FL=1